MPEVRTCSECGQPLREGASEALCPICALRSITDHDSELEASHAPLLRSLGDYELIEEIARGGMGVVFRARQKSLNRIVALKLVMGGPLASVAALQRFQAEAQAAASLQHPNIVAIHDVGEHAGQAFFSMDYVEGRNLAELLRDGPLPPRRAAGYVKTIAEAIEYAHQRGILHRDLKPSNVLIDPFDQPRITDFGLAKRLTADAELSTINHQLTLSGQVQGSPNFMAPEQAQGRHQDVGPPSDVYSLGALLYDLITGRPPFQAATLTEVLRQVATTEPAAPRLLNPSIPRDLETICLKCLEKEPAKRYATAQLLADELGRYLRKEPILARPISRAGRVWRWCRRNPGVATATGAAFLSLVIGLAGVTWQWRRVESQRARAEAGELSARQNAYAADMQAVQSALVNHDLGEALACLDRHRPVAGQQDLRGWEWRYFWQLCRSEEEFLLHRHTNSVGALAFSSEGKWLAVRRERGAVALWDTRLRKPVVQLPGSGSFKALALSPPGNLLAYGDVGSNGIPVVSLWNITTRQASQLPHQGGAARLAFSPDGTLLASWASDGVVRLWQVESRQLITSAQFSKPESDRRGGIVFSPQDRWLAIGEANAIRLWDWVSGEQWTMAVSDSREPVDTLALSPNGRFLIAAYNQIRVWDVAHVRTLPTNREVPMVGQPIEHRSRILDVAVAPDNRTLATAGGDQTVRLWDLDRRQEIRSYRGNTHEV